MLSLLRFGRLKKPRANCHSADPETRAPKSKFIGTERQDGTDEEQRAYALSVSHLLCLATMLPRVRAEVT